MSDPLFSAEGWLPALEKYGVATGLSVEVFDSSARRVLASTNPVPLNGLFQRFGADPGLFVQCARRCLAQTAAQPSVLTCETLGLAVVGAPLTLDGAVVGAAVAGYAISEFLQIEKVQRLIKTVGLPFERFWAIAQRVAPLPQRRLLLHGELLQVLGNALLQQHHRIRLHEDAIEQLRLAAAAKDEFLAVLSHELRGPLAAILGWATVLRQSERPEDVHRAAEAIERNALLQTRMVEDLLDLNRIAHGTLALELAPLSVIDCVRAALEGLAALIARKHLHVEVSDADEQLIVEADAGRLQQIFRNILSNAVKYTPEGGRIHIALSREQERARVLVSDTGIGIAPEFLPFAFDIFRQQEQGTRRSHEGLGIGLALVKRLIELQRGAIILDSAGVGQGTAVTVTFPLANGAVLEGPGSARLAQVPAKSIAGLSVLVIEDSADSRESLRLLLEQHGAIISVAHDGQEALEVIANGTPDVVLCDLRMPRMDGYEFIRELHRRRSESPPVIAMSGFASVEDRRRTHDAGFRAHIAKPFDIAVMIDAVEGAVKAGRRDSSHH